MSEENCPSLFLPTSAMKKYPVKARSCFDFICWAGGVGAVTFATSAVAQIVPDNTLGTERSTVTPAMVRGLPSDRIDGGAIRGSNLFHSFQQFNIGEGRGAYFANPAGIENILSRVTGNSRSEILGRLGVLGNANLFLLNPNGIVFDANASLDVAGSFTATTANAIALGDQGFFSATQPETSSLLAIAPGALYFDQQVRQPTTIQNSGNLTTGRDLTLAADNLELQGQLRSGGNLTLQAQDTLRIRDSVTVPFIASAGGKLLAQGDRSVDIFALNHPDSGLFSGGDMVLRSANQVGGDAHYYSGGNFRIEQLNGNLGNLYSPYDPIIRSLGNVSFDAYVGTSLHILAAGNVTVPGFIQITGADPTNGLVNGSVELSRDSIAIDGRGEPTLDIRAGLDPTAVVSTGIEGFGTFFNPLPNLGVPTLTNPPVSRADINIGTVIFGDIVVGAAVPNFLAGKILLTNQYRPNLALNGNIQIRDTLTGVPQLNGQLDGISIRSGSLNGGGSTVIDSRGTITINGVIQNSAIFNPVTNSFAGNGGDVTLLANDDITFNPSLFGFSIFSRGSLAGDITVYSDKNIIFNNSGILSDTLSTQSGAKSGSINITAGSLSLLNGSQLNTTTSGLATAGDINITVSGSFNTAGIGINRLLNQISPNQIVSNVAQAANAQGGNIKISAGSVSISDGTQISASLLGQGNAGNINIQDADSVVLSRNSSLLANVEAGGRGRGGGINIRSNSLSIVKGSQVQTVVKGAKGILGAGQGVAGDITIDVRDTATINGSENGIFSELDSNLSRGAIGRAGNISVRAGSLAITDGAQLNATTAGQGDAGSIFLTARDTITLAGVGTNGGSSGAFSTVEPGAVGKGGEIRVTTGSLSISNGAQLVVNARGQGDAGNINITARDQVAFAGVGNNGESTGALSTVELGALGKGGDITISAKSFSLNERAFLSALSLGMGGAGNITVRARSIRLRNNSAIATISATADGGNINLAAKTIVALENSDILASAPIGRGGNITFNTRAFLSDPLYRPVPSTIDLIALNALRFNDKVDVNASGAVSGSVTGVPDTTFIQNSLTQLAQNLIDPNTLLANSCIVRSRDRSSNGTFLVTGSGGLPVRPGDAPPASFPTGEVRSLPEAQTNQTWQPGDPIVEPQGIYRLANGKLVMSRECEP